MRGFHPTLTQLHARITVTEFRSMERNKQYAGEKGGLSMSLVQDMCSHTHFFSRRIFMFNTAPRVHT
jgi:hypothetical protein